MIFVRPSIPQINFLKELLDQYGMESGQNINFQKSKIFFMNTTRERCVKVSRILGCQIGSLPDSYLGTPLFIGKAKETYWSPLIEKVEKKLDGWKGSLLSQAGKLTMVKAVLQAIPVYNMSIFKLPDRVLERIERIQKRFLWSGAEEKKRLHLADWNILYNSKTSGGWGLRRAKIMNIAMVAKLGWRLIQDKEDWMKILIRKYLNSPKDLLSNVGLPSGSEIWKAIKSCRSVLQKGYRWAIGNGRGISIWEEPWVVDSPLGAHEKFASLRPYLERDDERWVDLWMTDGRWGDISTKEVPEIFKPLLTDLNLLVRATPMRLDGKNVIRWNLNPTGEYTVRSGYQIQTTESRKWDLAPKIWNKRLIPKVAIFSWLAVHNKILTIDNLVRKGMQFANRCVLCKENEESVNHLFILCPFAQEMLRQVLWPYNSSWVLPRDINDLFR